MIWIRAACDKIQNTDSIFRSSQEHQEESVKEIDNSGRGEKEEISRTQALE